LGTFKTLETDPCKGIEGFEGVDGGSFSETEPSSDADSRATTDANAPSPFAPAFVALQGRCPSNVDELRWRQAIDDSRCFLAVWGDQAEALGWTADDLFGLHPAAPLARRDAMGLVWLLRGRTVMALTATEAIIRASSDATLTFRRRSS
jgi:hypothetical protein